MSTVTIIESEDNELVLQEADSEVVVVTETDETTNTVTVESQPNNVVVTTEVPPEQLMVTYGGSVYRTAVQGGFVGSEVEWLSQVFDSKASLEHVTQVFSSAEEAWTQDISNFSAQVADNYANLNQLALAQADNEQARSLLSTNILTQVGDNYATNTQLSESIANAEQVFTQNFTELETNFQNNYASITQLDTAISNESSARTSQINTARSEIESGVDAQLTTFSDTLANEEQARVQMGQQLTANLDDGLSGAITQINEVDLRTNELSNVMASTVASLTGLDGTSAAALQKLESYETEGGLGARASLQTVIQPGTGNARVTGIVAKDDGRDRIIEFAADKTRWVTPEGNVAISFNTVSKKAVFDGLLAANMVTADSIQADAITGDKIKAGSSIQSPQISGGKITLSRGSYTLLQDPGNSIMFWYGLTSNSLSPSRENGLFWIDDQNNFSSTTYRKSTRGTFRMSPSFVTSTYTVPHKTVKGECDIDVFIGNGSRILNDITSFSGGDGTLVVRVKAPDGSIIGQVDVTAFCSYDSFFEQLTITIQPISFVSADNNIARNYYTNRTYTLEANLSIPVFSSSTSQSVYVDCSNCVLRTLEIREI